MPVKKSSTESRKTAAKAKRTTRKKAAITSALADKARNEKRAFPIVGVGASAGGLEALTALLAHLPANTGLAFVLVQHLDPRHQSILTELLAKETQMRVHEVADGMVVEPDNVYVIPPNTDMAILRGRLSLVPRTEARRQYMPIDYFFRSLAEDAQSNAIGVILSGTGTDGTLGLRAIKAEGGLAFAQDDKTAKYDGMPRSAVAAGVVDFILPPEGIADELARLKSHPYVVQDQTAAAADITLEGEDNLDKIFLLLRSATGVDFSYYKVTTIKRRVARRMLLHRISRLPQYLRYIKDNPVEIEELFQDLLINVTGFFREPELFDALKKKVFPRLLKERAPQSPLRIWVPGCSTGEEAYSIAICLLEYMNSAGTHFPIQIFGTDVSDTAVDKARAGIYLESIALDVSPERLRRYFVKTDGSYQISKPIRDLCIFAKQDLTRDPPFSKIDLLSCRNLLIYLTQSMQKKVIATFHYALRTNGILALGNSETIGGSADLFMLIDKKHKVYARKSTSQRIDYSIMEPSSVKLEPGKHSMETINAFDMQHEVDRVLLSKYAPAGVLVNEDLDIVQFRGHTGNFLEPASGLPNLNLIKMAREELAFDLRGLIQEAKKQNTPVSRLGARIKVNGDTRQVNLHVMPIVPPGSKERYLLVTFEELAPARRAGRAETRLAQTKEKQARRGRAERHMAQLEQELTITKEYLQSTIEQLETTNEELRSALEEVQSSNEELQSTNEELETAKEELQSTNEELTTVNEELQNRNFELTELNNDLINLISGVNIPIAILGSDFHIRRFTPMAEKVLNLISTDIGRPISDLRLNIDVPDLEKTMLDVIDKLEAKEFEVQDREGHWYSMRIRPYKTVDNKIDGVLIAWLDIDALKRGIMRTQAARTYAQAIIETSYDPLLILDHELHIRTANQAFYRTFHLEPEDLNGKTIHELGEGRWNVTRLRELLTDILPQIEHYENYELEAQVDGTHRKFAISARRTYVDDSHLPLTILAMEDITEC